MGLIQTVKIHESFVSLSFLDGYNGRSFTMGSKRKGGQVRFAAAQTARLEKEFTDHKYLHANDRKRLAQALKLTDRQVKTWFRKFLIFPCLNFIKSINFTTQTLENRRAKWRKVSVSKGHSRPEVLSDFRFYSILLI